MQAVVVFIETAKKSKITCQQNAKKIILLSLPHKHKFHTLHCMQG